MRITTFWRPRPTGLTGRLIPLRPRRTLGVRPIAGASADAASEAHDEFCRHLRSADQRSQESYDKLVIALAGGGLGVSLVVLKDIVGANSPTWPTVLVFGWSAWILCLLLALISFFTSHKGIRALLDAHADGPCDVRTNSWIKATVVVNISAGLSCVAGIVLVSLFTGANLLNKVRHHDQGQETEQSEQVAHNASARAGYQPQTSQGQGIRAERSTQKPEEKMMAD